MHGHYNEADAFASLAAFHPHLEVGPVAGRRPFPGMLLSPVKQRVGGGFRDVRAGQGSVDLAGYVA
ncbi:hypothetical protein ABZX95_14975, partial [Streptomyces sp. NPDC004232]|uniref:hypothetical protein n=1 Tax=Streptomyces sp. NPDC004232 TaxID=3154454 RepID=UPI0033B10117